MARKCRFVQPETVRLDLSNDDWLEVKKRLTVGEERQAMAAVVGRINQDGSRSPNIEMLGMAEAAIYIVDWSFTDANDKRVEFSLDALKQLDSDTYREIDAAIDAHKTAMAGEHAEEKKSKATELVSVAT